MRLTDAGFAALCNEEGLRLQAYPDPATGGKPWTIGIGCTFYQDRSLVKQGDTLTEAEAIALAKWHIAPIEQALLAALKVPVSDGQWGALVSLGFNIGISALSHSTLLAKLNAGDVAGAAAEFSRWDHVNGKENSGLKARRARERAMFEAATAAQPAPIEDRGTPDPDSTVAAPSGDKSLELPPDPAPAVPQYPVNPDGQGVPMLPALVLPLLSVLIDKIPEITALFGKDVPVADRNVGLATSVLKVATTALGAANEQEAVQKALDDPASLQKVKDAIQKEWFDQIKGSEATVGSARKFGLDYSQATNVRTVFWKFTFLELFSLLVMTMAAAGGGWVLYSPDFSQELKGAVVTLMLIGGFTGTKEYWLGTSDGSRSKDTTISDLAKTP